MSNTTEHLTYLAPDPAPDQISNFYADHSQLRCEMWTVTTPAARPHALVTFVPIRQRVALNDLDRTIEEALALLGWRARPDIKRLSFAWADETYSRGGYAFPDVNEIGRVGQRLYQQRDGLLFAGDWAQYSHSGYMEGALRSGVRAAHLIDQRPPERW